MTEQEKTLLCQGLARLNVPYTQQAVDKLTLYCDRLLEKTR